MALFLVQHGKSLSKEADPEQPLSEAGMADVRRISEVAARYGIRVSAIEHSEKKRAKQTAELLAAALQPADGIAEKTGLKPMDDVTAVAERVKAQNDVMLVGHLPFMEKLTSYLITGDTACRVIQFQNGGIVCLDQDSDSGTWFVKWALMPEIR